MQGADPRARGQEAMSLVTVFAINLPHLWISYTFSELTIYLYHPSLLEVSFPTFIRERIPTDGPL